MKLYFKKILSSFATGGVSEAITVAAPFVDKNSYLTVYIAAFIEYLAEGTDEVLAEFTVFMGSDFAAPPKRFGALYDEFYQCYDGKY